MMNHIPPTSFTDLTEVLNAKAVLLVPAALPMTKAVLLEGPGRVVLNSAESFNLRLFIVSDLAALVELKAEIFVADRF